MEEEEEEERRRRLEEFAPPDRMDDEVTDDDDEDDDSRMSESDEDPGDGAEDEEEANDDISAPPMRTGAEDDDPHGSPADALPQFPSSSSASLPLPSASSPARPCPADPSNLLLMSNAGQLYLLDPLSNVHLLASLSQPTTPIPALHFHRLHRNSFLLTIPPLALVVIASPGSDRVALIRVVQYEGRRPMLEWEGQLPGHKRGCGVRGVEVSRVEDGQEERGGDVWVLYILWEDAVLTAFQLSRAYRDAAALDVAELW